MSQPDPNGLPTDPPILRHGAVAVIVRSTRVLVIRRSQHVIAPGQFCFPGGGLEPGESETQALVREIREELGCEVRPLKRLWDIVTPWRVHLAWWRAELDASMPIRPNPLEVESVHWLSLEQIAALPDLLSGNREFVEGIVRGAVSLE